MYCERSSQFLGTVPLRSVVFSESSLAKAPVHMQTVRLNYDRLNSALFHAFIVLIASKDKLLILMI